MSGELARLQRSFQNYVLEADDAIHVDVAENAAADARRRLQVYHQAYRLRLAEVLSQDFPGLRQLLGTDAFDAMCRSYIEAHPSPHFNVRWYGERLPGFLGHAAPWLQTPSLAEMAALEWEMTLAFDAPDQPLASIDDVASLAPQDWPLMRLGFSASLRRIALRWNVAAIRLALDLERESPAAAEFPASREHAIWRNQLGVRHRDLEIDEAAALKAAMAGACFAELCEVLFEWHAEDAVALRAAELLKRWIHDQWVTQLIVPDADPQ
jgi:hypothetical protein